MRMNRNTRIGILLIGAALILLLVVKLFQGLTAGPTVVAENTSTNATNTAQPVGLSHSGVAFAKADIPERSIITADMIEMRDVARDTSGVNNALEITDPLNQAVGFITSRRILPGQRLMRSDLVGHITTVGISGALRPGFRAQIVPIPNKSTLHDLVAIGDFIDVIGSFDGQESRVIAPNVRVLAVDVFGKDFPQAVKIARRGDYKADPAGVGSANPPSPNTGAPGAQVAPQPGAPPAPTPTPTATPAGPPPVKPDPAITVEVTPDMAAAIALAQNSGAALDFILRPRPAVATVGAERLVSITKPRLAPYANSVKRGNTAPTRVASASSSGGSRNRGGDGGGYNPPPIIPSMGLPPANPNGSGSSVIAVAPETYQIPIYGDGKIARYDTVRKP